MTPDWLNETVQAFGRQMGLKRFALNDRGAAGVRFENGFAFRLEYAHEALIVSMAMEAPSEAATLRRILTQSHPDAVRGGLPVRAAFLARTGEALFAQRLAEREVTVTALEAVFRRLWALADAVRRAAR